MKTKSAHIVFEIPELDSLEYTNPGDAITNAAVTDEECFTDFTDSWQADERPITLLWIADELRSFALKQASKRANRVPKVFAGPYVYVMIDENTRLFKIGFSKKPSHREHTLSSQQPTITLLFVAPGTKKNESFLHNLFSARRVRGEWFRLLPADLMLLERYFILKQENERYHPHGELTSFMFP